MYMHACTTHHTHAHMVHVRLCSPAHFFMQWRASHRTRCLHSSSTPTTSSRTNTTIPELLGWVPKVRVYCSHAYHLDFDVNNWCVVRMQVREHNLQVMKLLNEAHKARRQPRALQGPHHGCQRQVHCGMSAELNHYA